MHYTEPLNRAIAGAIVEHWSLPCFSDYNGPTFTNAELAERIARNHILFRALGIKPGDRIALIGKSTTGWALAYLSIVTYGAVVVPILSDFKLNTILHIIKHSESQLLFTGMQTWERLGETSELAIKAIISTSSWMPLYCKQQYQRAIAPAALDDAFRACYPQGVRPVDVHYVEQSPETLQEINYTAGTSGFSKGVMVPGRALASNLEFAEGVMAMQPGDPVISLLPLAHAYGQAFEFLFCFLKGCHIYFLMRVPSPRIIFQAFGQIRPRLIIIVPIIIEKIYKGKIAPRLRDPKIRLLLKTPILRARLLRQFNTTLTEALGGNFIEVIVGGAHLNPRVEEFLKKIGFRYTVGYGMTECAPIITYAPWREHRLYTSGRPVVNMEVRIANADPTTGVGNIEVRGANLMLGYYKRPDLTAEAFTPDGWLRTGDLGSLDADGYLTIRGRSKDMILGPNGQNIYPEELEALIGNYPLVQEVLVKELDGKIVALVVPDYTTLDEQGLKMADLESRLEECRLQVNEELPAYSQISQFLVYPEEFEKTPKHSIRRFLYKAPGNKIVE